MAIVHICRGIFGSITLLFFSADPRVVTLTAPQTAGRRVSLCVRDYRAIRTVLAAPRIATAVVSSHNLVSGANGGDSMRCSSVDTRGHVSSVLRIEFDFVCAFFSSGLFL